jgi:outer membrane protein assembly factor BamB
MSWNPVRRLFEIPSRARLINAGGWLVFRDTKSLRAFGPDASAPAWLFEDPACGPWGCQRTVFAEGLVVSVMDHGRDEPVRIVALEPATGRVVWERSVALDPGVGALAVAEGLLRIVGTDGEGRSWLATLEPRSGQELSRVASPWAHTLLSIQGKIFFVGGSSVSVISKGDEAPRKLLDVEAFFPSADSRSLYFSQKTPGPLRVVCLDALNERIRYAREAPPEFKTISRIIPLDEEGRVAVISDGYQPDIPAPALMDLASDAPPARVEPLPGSWVGDGCLAGSSLALLHEVGMGGEVVLHDPATGRALRELGVRAHAPQGVFGVEGCVVVVGRSGLVFREDQPGDARLLEIEAHAEVAPRSPPPPRPEPPPSAADSKRAEELVALVQLFARCMSQRGSDEAAYRTLAHEFNARFTALLTAYPEESVGTFAMRLNQLGIPYATAFSDLISVRGVGAVTSRPAKKKRAARGATAQAQAESQAVVERTGPSMPDSALRRTGEASSPGPRASPRFRWKIEFATSINAAPIFTNGVLVVVTEEKIIGVDPKEGCAIWSVKALGRILASPAWADGVVFVGDDGGYVHALDVRSAQVRWRASTGPIFEPPVVARGLVLLSAYRHGSMALDAATGERVWKFKSGNQASGATVVGDRVYFASSGVIHGRDLVTGKEISKLHPPEAGRTRTALVVQGSRAVIGTQKNGVVALDLERSELAWTHPSRRRIDAAPAFVGGRVFVGPWGENLHALDATSGAELWRASSVRASSSPRVAGDAVYVGNGYLLSCLDAATGERLWEHSLQSDVQTPWIEDGVVYAADSRGNVVALS